jgi:Holliday junction resolvase
MNSKAKGARSELKVRDQLLEDGWYVTKAGGSLGLWDLIAIHPGGTTRLIQVKTNRRPRPAERVKLLDFSSRFIKVECFVALVRDRAQTLWERVVSR